MKTIILLLLVIATFTQISVCLDTNATKETDLNEQSQPNDSSKNETKCQQGADLEDGMIVQCPSESEHGKNQTNEEPTEETESKDEGSGDLDPSLFNEVVKEAPESHQNATSEASPTSTPTGPSVVSITPDQNQTISNSDKQAQGRAILNANSTAEAPKKAATKDTTILVALFVAVVVIGAIAFGYNRLQKRKSQAADAERAVLGPGTQTEEKPLMGQSKEVELKDISSEQNGTSTSTN